MLIIFWLSHANGNKIEIIVLNSFVACQLFCKVIQSFIDYCSDSEQVAYFSIDHKGLLG